MKWLAIIPVLVAAGLLGGASYLSSQPEKIRSAYKLASGICNPTKLLCATYTDLLKELGSAAHQIARAKVARTDLPVIQIFISDGALRKIDQKRLETLAKKKPILISRDDDWVEALIITDDGSKKRKTKVALRLKGDWGDHFKDPRAMSFRIKVKNNNYILGMKKLSIQHPKTRWYAKEMLILDHMRENGVLAPRYFFADLRINGNAVGVMGVEEHFSKELVERQERREGPIMAFDEDFLWRQWDLNVNVNGLTFGKEKPSAYDVSFVWQRDVALKEFRQPKYVLGTIKTNNTIRASSLMRDYLDGKVREEDVFDGKLLARWWTIVHMFHGCHGVVWSNRRYFFNTVTNLFEPIAYDNMSNPKKYRSCVHYGITDLKTNAAFLAQVIAEIHVQQRQLDDAGFKRRFNRKQKRLLKLLRISGMKQNSVKVAMLSANLKKFLSDVQGQLKKTKNKRSPKGKWPELARSKFLESNAAIGVHLTAFREYKGDKSDLKLRNLTLHPIDITGVYALGKNGRHRVAQIAPFGLPSYQSGSMAHLITRKLPVKAGRLHAGHVVAYVYRGKRFEQKLHRLFRNHVDGLDHDFVRTAPQISPNIVVNAKAKSIRFPAGRYKISKSYLLPKGWSVRFDAGASLELVNGALLKIRGPLISAGWAGRPVRISIESNLNFQNMGSWGGLLVSQAGKGSRINHTIFEGTKSQNLKNRQDYYGLTGCVSFYESPVKITNSQFNRMQCEDALNIARSDFTLRNVAILQSRADGFDSDFSKGTIVGSSFREIGNDGVDISGTRLMASRLSFHNIVDKAISVGENSRLTANAISVDTATTGVASKDLSRATLRGSIFSRISGTALMTYIKKQEYGPAKILCRGCSFKAVNAVAANQNGSSIKINGEQKKRTNFTRKQLIEAGYIAS